MVASFSYGFCAFRSKMGGVVSAGVAVQNMLQAFLVDKARRHYQLCGVPVGHSYDLSRGFEATWKSASVSSLSKPMLEYTGKLILPKSSFQEIAYRAGDDPMMFRVSTTTGYAHAGVQEFVAADGRCYLPQWIMRRLNVQDGSDVKVELVKLPRGTYVKFQPSGEFIRDVRDPKLLLEHVLRHFTTLSVGDILPLRHNARVYDLKVLELRPAAAVCILDTDLNVDFDSQDVANAVVAQDAVRSVDDSSVIPVVFDESITGYVGADDFVYYRLDVSGVDDVVVISVLPDTAAGGGDPDVYVTPTSTLPTHSHCVWRSTKSGPKSLKIAASHVAFRTPLTIGVSALVASHFVLTISRASCVHADDVDDLHQLCSNCGESIPTSRIAMHQAFCERNNSRCEQCDKIVQLKLRDEHQVTVHAPVVCVACGQQLEQYQLRAHRAVTCPRREVLCKHCGLSLEFCSASEHEEACAGRTYSCPECAVDMRMMERVQHRCNPLSQGLEASRLYGAQSQELECPGCGVWTDDWEALQVHMLTECENRVGVVAQL
eukprot:TRINITY_DN624_c0_g2_i2.p1 TRINITY_DN624_c0_g2~~TRINITY_DN624_c0_g2_i2.p1  ORF type:complete len:545 (+),score=64.48 TRINITY_DN624_c0_g2_i2:1235-2869(+)